MPPTLSATDGAVGSSVDQIKRVDLTPEDIRNMTDEELTATYAMLRRSRETTPPRASKARKAAVDNDVAIVLDDGDLDSNV